MNPIEQFENERADRIKSNRHDEALVAISRHWVEASMLRQYVYNFEWLGRPIIQFPQDIQAVQEIVWKTKPDLIVETGIAHGGSLVLSASLLALLDYCDAAVAGEVLDPAKPRRKVVGVDVDIRAHNRAAITAHPMSSRIEMVQGSSIAPEVVAEVRKRAAGITNILVLLDSNHTHGHVLEELHAYSSLVPVGGYCVVFDTFVEDLPVGFFANRPWDPGNSPKTAVQEFLASNPDFESDTSIDSKLLVSASPFGFLRRVR